MKLLKKSLPLLVFLVMLVCTLLPVFATPDSTTNIFDLDFLLAEEERTVLNEKAKAASERCGVSLYAVISSDRIIMGENFLSANGYDQSEDIALLIITRTDEWHYDLYTYGKAVKEITDKEIDRILDHPDVYDNLKAGNLAYGISAYLDKAEVACSSNLAPQPGKVIAFALVGGIIVSAITTVIVILIYRMKIKKTNYPLDKYARLQPGAREDVFTGATTTRRKVSSNTGSGGGGGVGGGGGHRGGR